MTMIDFSQIKMTDKEKAEMRGNILRAVRSGQHSRHIVQRSSIFALLTLNFKPMMVGLTLMIALVASLGTGLAAQGALPGDFLYPVKVSVNEEARSVLAFSESAKADWELERSERRLEEAETLAESNRFDGNVRAQVEANFEKHADKVNKRIEKFESEGNTEAAAELSSNFEVSLKTHERILSKLDGEEVNKFLPKLRVKKNTAATFRAGASAKISGEAKSETKVSAEGKLKAAENKIAEVRKYLEGMNEAFGADATAEAEARLKVADAKIIEGKAKMSAGVYAEAFILFQGAHRIAQEAKLLIEARSQLKVNLEIGSSSEIDIEDRVEVQEKDTSGGVGVDNETEAGVKLRLGL